MLPTEGIFVYILLSKHKEIFIFTGWPSLFIFVFYSFIYLSSLEYNCFTMLCWFLPSTSWINYIYMYIYPLPLEPPSTLLGHHRAPSWVPCATLAILHKVVCIHQCCSLNSPHPPLCPQVHPLHLCLCPCPVNRLITSTYFHLVISSSQDFHPWVCSIHTQSLLPIKYLKHFGILSLVNLFFLLFHFFSFWACTHIFYLCETCVFRAMHSGRVKYIWNWVKRVNHPLSRFVQDSSLRLAQRKTP